MHVKCIKAIVQVGKGFQIHLISGPTFWIKHKLIPMDFTGTYKPQFMFLNYLAYMPVDILN